MAPEFFIVLGLIAVLSVVQSIFGMGVLIFGTPTLLLLNYDFVTTLALLLPASFAISVMQVFGAGSNRVPISFNLYVITLPGIGAGLWLASVGPASSWINVLVGVLLLLTALIRLWSPSRTLLNIWLNQYPRAYHFLMGLVHGLTNLGGALLALLASGTQTDKMGIRFLVAYYYLAFSSVQILILITVLGQLEVLVSNLGTMIISVVVYVLIGNRLFLRANDHSYSTALSVFIAVYGLAVLLSFWLR